MKITLLAATALIAASTASVSAQASDPIKLKLGGFMYHVLAAADQDAGSKGDQNAQNFDVISSAEVYFGGTTTLDNGMTIGVDVQLEAGTRSGNDDIDESYMWLAGKYGKLIVGSENDVAYKMGMSAPSVSVHGVAGYDDAINDFLMPGDTTRGMIVSVVTGDANKLSYITPRMYGLQAGVSYTPSNPTPGDDAAGGATVLRTGGFDDAVSLALNYDRTFDGVGLKAGVAYNYIDDSSSTNKDGEVSDVNLGMSLSYNGFTVGGAALITNADTGTNYSSSEGLVWNIGAQYKEGPYGVSANYYSSAVEGTNVDDENDDVEVYQLSGTYQLGAGVKVVADLAYMDAESETNVKANGNEGAIGGTLGLKLDF